MNLKRCTGSILSLSIFCCLVLAPATLQAVQASPEAVEATQPDGRKFKFHLRGDEYFSWHEDERGYVIQRDDRDAFWKYATPKVDTAGFDIVEGARVGVVDPAALRLTKHDLPQRELLRERFRRAGSGTPGAGAAPAAELLPGPGADAGLTTEAPPPVNIPVSGTKTVKNIVILASFNDHWDTVNSTVLGSKGRVAVAEYTNLFNQVGHTTDGAVGSVKDYYSQVSYNKLTVDSVVTVWVRLPQNEAYYGAAVAGGSSDTNPRQMVADAIAAADAAGFDFSQGDTDGDGWVDSLTVIHSGHGQEYGGNPTDCIWSHKWELSAAVTVDGVKIKRYHTEPALRSATTSTAIIRIGVICHELGHFFGLPDLYDYSALTHGIGDWGLMAGGSWNGSDGKSPAHLCAWSKYMLGFVKPVLMHAGSSLSLPRVEDNAVVHLYTDGAANGEYFLVENRARYGFDNTAEIYPGILVYHIDSKSANNDLATWAHPAVKIEEADGNNSLGAKTAQSQAGDVWTSTSGLAGGLRDQSGDQDANAMLYQAAHYYNRADSAASYTYLRLSAFSAPGSTMTYTASTLKPTVAGGSSVTGNYTVTWGAASNATQYEIQEGSPVTLTSFADGAESERALYENWAIQGDARRSSGGFRTGSYGYVFQIYDSAATRWYSAVQGLTMRNPFTVKSTTNISFYYLSNFGTGSGYLKYQVSKDGGTTWQTLGTQSGWQSAWTQLSYGYANLNALGINENDQCLFRFIANFEQASGYTTTWPTYGYAIDDFQIANVEMPSSGNWTTLSANVGTNSFAVGGRSSGTYAYQVQAYANGVWQGYGSAGVETVTVTAPTVMGATSSTANGQYPAGAAINVTLNFSEAVSSAGLTINLNSGGSVSTGALSGATSYSGTHTVGAGQTSADLSIGSITGTITNAATTATVNPAVPAGQNIADGKAIVIDTTAPTVGIGVPSATVTRSGPVSYAVTYVDTNFNASTLAVGNVTLHKTGSANGTVGVSGSGTTRSVTINSVTGDGTLGISIAAGTATDVAGNTAPAAGPSATFKADNSAPATTPSPGAGTYAAAQSVTLSCDDGAGAGCASTSWCTGGGCTPATPYSGDAISIPATTDVRFASTDGAGNAETIKTASYTICTLAVAPTSISLPANAAVGLITITTPPGCAWTTAADSWLTITSGSSGSGSADLRFSVTANTTAGARSGNIDIGGQSVAIEQAAQPLTAGFVGLVGGTVYENPFGPPTLDVTFDARGSRGLEAITDYQWAFGDGATENTTTAEINHSYPDTGSYLVTLTVVAGSQTATTQRLVTVAGRVHNVTSAAGLQAALTTAQANGEHDLIRIAAGTYNLSDNGSAHFTYLAAAGEDRDLVLEGGWTPDFSQRAYNLPTTLEHDLLLLPMDDGGVLLLDGVTNATAGAFIVDGLRINGGYATNSGGGLFAVNGGGITLSNSIISNNTAYGSGGGLFLQSGSGVWVTACTISDNYGNAAGAGVVLAPSAYLFANEIAGNAAIGNGGLQVAIGAGGELIAGNNTIHGNQATAGSAGLAAGLTTVPGGSPLPAGGARGPASFDIHNNIIYGNTLSPGFSVDPDCTLLYSAIDLSVAGNDLENAAVCADYPLNPGNVQVEPWFITHNSSDIRLRPDDTTLIDAGTSFFVPAQDIEGDDVPLDGGSGTSIADIGADEYNPANPTGPTTVSLTPPGPAIDAIGGSTTLTVSFDHPVKRDVVLYLTHVDTNTDSPGQALVTVTPHYLKILRGASSATVTVQALSAARHGTSEITASDPAGVLPVASGSVTVAIVADTTAPTGSILINSGAAYTTTTSVTLQLSATDGGSGLDAMRFANSGGTTSAWEPYQTTKTWRLSSASGTKVVYVQFRDKAGNVSDADPVKAGAQSYKDDIVFDPTAPTGSILISNGAAYTTRTAVTLNLSAVDSGGSGLDAMRFANSGGTATTWEPYATTKTWTLASGAGTKIVYVQFRDKAGNISDADSVKAGAQSFRDDIVYDPTPPTGSIFINGDAPSTTAIAVTLNLSAADTGSSGLDAMRFVNSGGTVSAWEPYAATKDWTLTSGAGTKTVYAQFRDKAGNISDADPVKAGAQSYADTIVYSGP